MADYETLKVFSGNSNQDLSEKIAKKIGIPIGKALVGRFSDGEIQVELHEDVRGKDVFVKMKSRERPVMFCFQKTRY